MGASTTQAETRLALLLQRDEMLTQQAEALHREAAEGDLSEVQQEQLNKVREDLVLVREEYASLATDIEGTREAMENAKRLRRAMAGAEDGVEESGDGIVYRDFATYARDVILTRQSTECSKIAKLAGGEEMVLKARERLQLLQRVPANTLSSNVGGLIPPQHIAQIFQIIDDSRPLVAAAQKTTLERGTLTYPKVTTRPVVAVQNTEKTEAGNTGMVIDMVTATASTYLGGGDLSWQAINWSTPDALSLWFQLAAADYALKTEQDAGQVVRHSGFTNIISSPLASNADFATTMTGIGAGYAKVYSVSQRLANTLLVAPDRYAYLLGLTSTPQAIFVTVGGERVGPLNILISRGLDSGSMYVGDMAGLLVAETAGAPVELRVVEPAIGGVEVGIIGAFEADVVDNGAFAQITTAS